MFPSANYFRDIPCPFFSRVSCPRPHCHFKHIQAQTQVNVNNNASPINIPADANETLNKLITQLSSAAAANTTATLTANTTPSLDFTSFLQSTLLQSLTTVLSNALNNMPQTSVVDNHILPDKNVQTLNPVVTAIDQQQNVTPTVTTNTNGSVPEYRPTPIAELERRKRVQQQTFKSTSETEINKFDSNDYVKATFSPPSGSPESAGDSENESMEDNKPNVSLASKPIQSVSDENHRWITPPVREKRPSGNNYNDFDERISSSMKNVVKTDHKQLTIGNITQNKPVATVKPNIVGQKNTVSTTSDPLTKKIPKISSTQVRNDNSGCSTKVVTTNTILTSNKASVAVKRSSNGPDETLQKKAKIIPTVKQKTTNPNLGNINKTIAITTNGNNRNSFTDEDDELALFDNAFSVSQQSESSTTKTTKKIIPARPPTMAQQLFSRYLTNTKTSDDSNSTASTTHTRAETSTDGRRIAHKPKFNPSASNEAAGSVLYPIIDPNSSSLKIPLQTRREYLTFFVNELQKYSTNKNEPSATAAINSRARMIEKDIFDKATSKNSYLNLAAKYLRQIRAEQGNTTNQTQKSPTKKPNAQRLVVSHSSMLTGGRTENVSFGIKKTKEVDVNTLTESELYTLLFAYKALDTDLIENGYPKFSLDFPDKVLIKAKNSIYNSSNKTHSADPYTRVCCRCGKSYKVKDGIYLKEETCIYHWGRLQSQRIAGQIEKTYSCCSAKASSAGCGLSEYHVNDADDNQLLSGYVKTQPIRGQLNPDESYGIYALDCEMVYTINGLELVRVSVVNHKLQSVYESLVKPKHKILDYNTRWSGITESSLRDCNVKLNDVQQVLLKLFNNKTILIGHSLESDLKALKIVHDVIIDTSLVFPHSKGRPYKRALKTLMQEYLTKMIQENTAGHNSIEDAISCMELMLWKVKQDLKTTSTDR